MLVVIAFCQKDAAAACNLLDWMLELDGRHTNHTLLLVASCSMDQKLVDYVNAAGHRAFQTATLVKTTQPDERPWPHAPNTMFKCTLAFVKKHHRSHFWWNEPDCIPLKPGWLDSLETEYIQSNQPFMGRIVDRPFRHLTGCAIYPANVIRYNPAIAKANHIPWDCVDPLTTLRQAHHTDLIQHEWGDYITNTPLPFKTVKDLEVIRLGAVVFHRNKNGDLIKLLRKQRSKR